ncbi:DUF3703 domain-containing protein [Pseudomaricurvus sp.]|uniref:DUF3703 domain-containing protein n=1 Tax=Pseudomaricurvus sp. TaxID=2004510 RepID=UPI003F6CBBBD
MNCYFAKHITPFVQAELTKSDIQMTNGASQQAFKHLENAHILGQESTYWHVKVHYHMLLWGLKEKDTPEIRGQLLRIIGAATKTAFGMIPKGNSGGANISPFKSLPVDKSLADIILNAKL